MPPDTIPLCEPHMGGNERAYVADALEHNQICQGPYIERFEQSMCDYLGVCHAVAVSSGTAALHLALLAVGVGPDDEVLVSDLTFIAPVNAIAYCGATPVLVDAEPEYWQMDQGQVAEYLRLHGGSGVVKAILPVHILGHPVRMQALLDAGQEHGIAVIEDATESLGATYTGRKVGTLGDAACLSFNGNKLLTTGQGGMVVTDNADIAERVRHLATQAKADPNEYQHDMLGYNYRMPNVNAAIGCAQLESRTERLSRKAIIAYRYMAALRDVPGISFMQEASWAKSAWWQATIRVDAERYGMDSRRLMRELASVSIQARPLWAPAHLQPMYRQEGFPVAEALWRDCLALPCSVGLTERQQKAVILAIRELGRQ